MIIDTSKLPDNLSLNAIKILCIIHEALNAINGTEIAIRSGVHYVSVNQYLYKFETAGLVVVSKHLTDRRQRLYTLSRQGREQVQSWQPAHETLPA